MACGKPVVGTNVGGIKLQIKDNKNGFLVEPKDVGGTAEKILGILNSERLAKKMSTNSVEESKKFGIENAMEKHLSIYNKLITQKNPLLKLESLDKSKIKAIITDFDRTLTNLPPKIVFDEKEINFELLGKLGSLGYDLFLATGRPFRFVQSLCKKFSGFRCIIAENGAVVYFPRTKRILVTNSEYMKKAKAKIQKLGLPHTVLGLVSASIKAVYARKAKKELGSLTEQIKIVKNADDLLFLPAKVDKGYGIRTAFQYLNIDLEKTIVIGDGENDVEMFINPGYKIALANAHPRLKKLASEITKNNSENGILEIIKKLSK